jgi:hypothetical protein
MGVPDFFDEPMQAQPFHAAVALSAILPGETML